jgi:hypothetical protein
VLAAVAGAAAAALVALFWALTHALVLRGDMRWLAQTQARVTPEEAVVVAAGQPATGAGPALVPAVAGAGAVAVVTATAATRYENPPPYNPMAGTPAAAGAAVAAAQGRQFSRQELAPLAADAGVPMVVPQDELAGGELRLPYALAVIDGADGAVGAALAAALRVAHPDAMIWAVGLTREAEAAMLAALGETEPAPSDALGQVAAILAPSDALFSAALVGEDGAAGLAAALEGSPARLILLPPRNPRFRWAAAPTWPLERWVDNAVVEAGNALDAATAK